MIYPHSKLSGHFLEALRNDYGSAHDFLRGHDYVHGRGYVHGHGHDHGHRHDCVDGLSLK